MKDIFTLSEFNIHFPSEEACLKIVKELRYPDGIYCIVCKSRTKHYKINHRTAYACKDCRNQVYPLKDTIFEKSTTPLRVWLYAIYLMLQTQGDISSKQLQRELGVTYKTAWRIHKSINALMDNSYQKKSALSKWRFFYKIEYTDA